MKFSYCLISLIIMVISLTMMASCGNKMKEAPSKHKEEKEIYTCPMHPQIIRDEPGTCPICGMDLVKKETGGEKSMDVELDALLRPTNEFVVSSMPITTIQLREEQIEIEALGNIAYDTRQAGSISSRITGRIEKLYVQYQYQKIVKGQRILDMYSPEIMTAQQNLLFLLKNDPANSSFIQAAKDKLLLLGMSSKQLQQVIQSGVPTLTISVYSSYSGHIRTGVHAEAMNTMAGEGNDISRVTDPLTLREGMYLQKGQTVFTVYNPDKAWVILNIYGENQGLIKKGNIVRVTPETAPDKDFRATIDFIEPYYRTRNKTLTARVYFNNSSLKIPIGSSVRATVFGNTKEAYWLPKDAVVSLGLDKVVFLKTGSGFNAHRIHTGITHEDHIQILDGLHEADSVAVNAQYLMDSESFIKVNN